MEARHFRADGTKAHKTALMCVDAVESKYQSLNKFKLLFDSIVHHQQHLHWFLATFHFVWQSLREISPNVTFGLQRGLCPITTFILKWKE